MAATQSGLSLLVTFNSLTVSSPSLKAFFLPPPSGVSPPERTNRPRLLGNDALAARDPPSDQFGIPVNFKCIITAMFQKSNKLHLNLNGTGSALQLNNTSKCALFIL